MISCIDSWFFIYFNSKSAAKDDFTKARSIDEQFGELWKAVMAFNEDYKIRSFVIHYDVRFLSQFIFKQNFNSNKVNEHNVWYDAPYFISGLFRRKCLQEIQVWYGNKFVISWVSQRWFWTKHLMGTAKVSAWSIRPTCDYLSVKLRLTSLLYITNLLSFCF